MVASDEEEEFEELGALVVEGGLPPVFDYQLGDELTDLDLGRQLQAVMICGDRVRFVGPGLHPTVMLGIIQRCTAVIAMRLHAQIFAMAVGRPVYGLSFEPKCDEFLASVGVVPIRPEEVTGDGLARWLTEIGSPAGRGPNIP